MTAERLARGRSAKMVVPVASRAAATAAASSWLQRGEDPLVPVATPPDEVGDSDALGRDR
jgi:hypothetical protein